VKKSHRMRYQFDLERAEALEYSHREACEILGCSSNALQLLNKRGFALHGKAPLGSEEEPPHKPPKRGKGRRYSFMDLTYIGLFQIIARYMVQSDAAETARISVPVVLKSWFSSARKDDGYLVFSQLGGMYAASFFPHASLTEQLEATDLVVVSLRPLANRLFAGLTKMAVERQKRS
jgi:hypothetical protein